MITDIERHYNLLGIGGGATDDEIVAAYKKLALRYHPDKNPHRVEWATEAMTQINLAYSAVMSHRFRTESIRPSEGPPPPEEKKTTPQAGKTVVDSEVLTGQFINHREGAKDSLYRYYQYSLYRLTIREKMANRAIFNKIVFALRKSYHAIHRLARLTDDPELIEHFEVFTVMLINFYRASECLNIIDSYANQYDVEAYRIYKQGDEDLTIAGKEIFYDRHNRGYFKLDMAYEHLIRAEKTFSANLKVFPKSSWAVETGIKLEFVQSLRKYIELFFSDYTRP
ncbi:MAG: J domain-containing protein [Chrysiogenales bacterium]|nr:MAG: J domain-containing protein [Chrysiogenales bacterium]